VIVAAEIARQANESHQLLPMLEQVKANLGRKPEAASADAGYWSEASAADGAGAGIRQCEPIIMRMVEVLPAPLGPRSPNILPASISRLRASTATLVS
jgi:hypothetical protein